MLSDEITGFMLLFFFIFAMFEIMRVPPSRKLLSNPLNQQSLTVLATRSGFLEDNFSKDWLGLGRGGMGWGSRRRRRCGDGFGMIQGHYIYCASYFYYYYIVIYNDIIIQLTIMQNQWEP